MAFVQSMNSLNTIKIGVNGADVYTEEGVGDYRVSLFTMLNRDLSSEYIDKYVAKIYNRNINNEMRDLLVMAFQTRDVRGGKGERLLFYNMIHAIYKHNKDIVKLVLKLIPEYGCWRDMWELLKLIPDIEEDLLKIVKHQYYSDLSSYYMNEYNKISLLAKWLPREGSCTYPGLAKKLADFILSEFSQSSRKRIIRYRKDISMLNKTIKTVEINMCNKSWASIKPESVPGQCLKNNNKAFLNETLAQKLRYPSDLDRMECRTHFKEFIKSIEKGEKKAHGASVVQPHELVSFALNHINDDLSLKINQAQWDSIRNKTMSYGGLGKCVPMCDFSGSMDGRPKLISLALGILISEINHKTFRDHILTFDSEPKWHSFDGKITLQDKLKSISKDIGIGLNTNFYLACKCIIEKMKEHRVPVGEEPEDLIVLTDMGFDYAYRGNNKAIKWETQLETIRKLFKLAGEEIWGEGKGWKVPRIVIWNLRAEFKEFYAKADQQGVVQLSGWSPSILKALQKGGVEALTPYDGMRNILDDSRYDPVREIWDSYSQSI